MPRRCGRWSSRASFEARSSRYSTKGVPVLQRGQDDGGDQYSAVGDLQDVGRNVEGGEQALQQEDVDRADRRADEPTLAAGKADATERYGRDSDQRIGRADVGIGRADQSGEHKTCNAGE